MLFQAILYAVLFLVAAYVLWKLIGKRTVESLCPEERPAKSIKEVHERITELEKRKTDLLAKRTMLETIKEELNVTEEEVKVTEELAQLDMTIDRVMARLNQLNRIRSQSLHL